MTGETTVRTAVRIHGRSAHREAVRALLDGVRTHSGHLVVTGEPGLGRTALLQWAAHSFRAGPVLHLGPGADRGAHATAGELLGTLRAAAGDAPLLVCADDADLWEAPARAALGRAAERLHTVGRVALLLSVAGHRAVDPEYARLPVARLDPLAPSHADALLDDVTGGATAPAVREQLLAEAEGNPALLLALVRRLSPAELRGHRPLPHPLADAGALAAVAGPALSGRSPDVHDLLLTVAAAVRASDGPDADTGLVLDALRRLRAATAPAPTADPLPEPLPDLLAGAGDRLRFHSPLLCRAVHVTAAPQRRRAAHRALADVLETGGHRLPALLHRSWSLPGPGPAVRLAERLAVAAADGAEPACHGLRGTAYARAAELTADPPVRAERYTAAAEQALLAGRPDRARPLLAAARGCAAPAAVRGRAELVRGLAELRDGPVGDAHQSLLLAATLLAEDAPADAATAALAAADAAWAAGDLPSCLSTLAPGPPSVPDAAPAPTGILTPDEPCGPADAPAPAGSEGSGALTALDPPTASAEPPGRVEALAQGQPPGPVGAPVPGESRGPVGIPVPGESRGPVGAPVPVGAPGSSVPTFPGVPLAPGELTGPAEASVQGRLPGPVGAPVLGDSSNPVKPPDLNGLPASQPPTAQPPTAPSPGGNGGGATGGVQPRPNPAAGPGPGGAHVRAPEPDPVRDHRAGMRALLEGRLDRAAPALGQVVERARNDDRPERLLRAASAALLLGNVDAARRAGARALAAARQSGSDALVPQALEYLAYAELRAGRHPQARVHAEDGLRTALRVGQRNTAAHHQAVLALAASIEEEPEAVARHVTAALATARRHGLAQAATLAEWAAARADLGRGRPHDAADRLGLLVLPGPGRGHFAVWRLAVPCFVEAAALAGHPEDTHEVLTDFAGWAAFGADPQAAAQLARCHALLAPPDRADDLYRRALARHDEAGGDFERARTALLYGKWLRRRRRPREARGCLGTALAGFDRCGAGAWAAQASAELRALGAAPRTREAGPLTRLTPQQLRIARHVAEGATNREVALTLAVSTRTVDYHLRKVFAALGVRSRLELARMVEHAERAQAAGRSEKTGAQP
ncbi:LuxR C-terminal-related transcriptional regulator [Streptomyces sp. NPDC057367]|uniref:helix-turn-helix transcriptional regulator n=1 Tax=Streptomyces sp. NPDC057367 TaxID=3346108 RepID=UPI003643A98F